MDLIKPKAITITDADTPVRDRISEQGIDARAFPGLWRPHPISRVLDPEVVECVRTRASYLTDTHRSDLET